MCDDATPSKEVVCRLPLDRLLLRDCSTLAVRVGDVGADEIVERLRRQSVRFVVAEVGAPLNWIPIHERFRFWKESVRPRVASPEVSGFRLDEFPGEYAFRASLWEAEGHAPIVLLERYH